MEKLDPEQEIVFFTTEDGVKIDKTKTLAKYAKNINFINDTIKMYDEFKSRQQQDGFATDGLSDDYDRDEDGSIIFKLLNEYCKKWWLEEYLLFVETMSPFIEERNAKIKEAEDQIKIEYENMRRSSQFNREAPTVNPEDEEKELKEARDKIMVKYEDNQPEWDTTSILMNVYNEGSNEGSNDDEGIEMIRLFINFINLLSNGELYM